MLGWEMINIEKGNPTSNRQSNKSCQR